MVTLNQMLELSPRLASCKLSIAKGDSIITVPFSNVSVMAHKVAAELERRGIKKGDRVGISAHNSLEALVLDLAVVLRRGVTAGVQADQNRLDPVDGLNRFGLALFFVENKGTTHPDVLPISTVGEWIAGDGKETSSLPPPKENYTAEDIFAIKFTSGSTGPPKGLEATVASVVASLDTVQRLFAHGSDDNILVFLPQNLLQQRYWVYSAFLFSHDLSLVHVHSASDAKRISWMAQKTKPTVIMGVPAFYNALREELASEEALDPEIRHQLIQQQLGGRIRYLWTGSAPISLNTLKFYNEANVPLFEGYGLNETCIVAKNHPGAFKIGSAGKVVSHKSIRFDDDGVIIVKSKFPINTRYTWCQPHDNEKIFLDGGEVFTNDVGYIDDDGFLFVKGRKDDVFVLTTGKSVLIPPIEHILSEHSAIRHVALFGNQQAFLSAVIDFDANQATDAEIRAHIDRVNTQLLPEQRAHAIVPARCVFSLANGCLGNQGKLVRGMIAEIHKSDLEAVYAPHTAG